MEEKQVDFSLRLSEEKKTEKSSEAKKLRVDDPAFLDEISQAAEVGKDVSKRLADPLKDFLLSIKQLKDSQRGENVSFIESYEKIYTTLLELSEEVNKQYQKYNRIVEKAENLKRLQLQQPEEYRAVAKKLNQWVADINALVDEYNEGIFIAEQVMYQLQTFTEPRIFGKAEHLSFFPQGEEGLWPVVFLKPVFPPENCIKTLSDLNKQGALDQIFALIPLLSMEGWKEALFSIQEEYLHYIDSVLKYGYFSFDLSEEALAKRLSHNRRFFSHQKGVQTIFEEKELTEQPVWSNRIAQKLNLLGEEVLSTLLFTSTKKCVEYFSKHPMVQETDSQRAVASLFFLEEITAFLSTEKWHEKLTSILSDVPSFVKERIEGVEKLATFSLLLSGLQLVGIETGLKGLPGLFLKTLIGDLPVAQNFLGSLNGYLEKERFLEGLQPFFLKKITSSFSRLAANEPDFWLRELTQKCSAYKMGRKEKLPYHFVMRFLEAAHLFALFAVPSYEPIATFSQTQEVFTLQARYCASRCLALLQQHLKKHTVSKSVSLDWEKLEEQLTASIQEGIESNGQILPEMWEKKWETLLELISAFPPEKRGVLWEYFPSLAFFKSAQKYVETLPEWGFKAYEEVAKTLSERYFSGESLPLTVIKSAAETILAKTRQQATFANDFLFAVQKSLLLPTSWNKRVAFIHSTLLFLERAPDKEEESFLFRLAAALQEEVVKMKKENIKNSFWPASLAVPRSVEQAVAQMFVNRLQDTPYFDMQTFSQALAAAPHLFSLNSEIYTPFLLLAATEAQSFQELQEDVNLYSSLLNLETQELNREVIVDVNEAGVQQLEEAFAEKDFSEPIRDFFTTLPQIHLLATPLSRAEKAEDLEQGSTFSLLGITTFKGYFEKVLARIFLANSFSLHKSLEMAKQVSDETMARTWQFTSSDVFKQIASISIETVFSLQNKRKEFDAKAIIGKVSLNLPLRKEILQRVLEIELNSFGIPFHKLEKSCFSIVQKVFKLPNAFSSLESFKEVVSSLIAEKGGIPYESAKERVGKMEFGLVLEGESDLSNFATACFSKEEMKKKFLKGIEQKLAFSLKEEGKSWAKEATRIFFGKQFSSCYEQAKQVISSFESASLKAKILEEFFHQVVFVSPFCFLFLKNMLLPNEALLFHVQQQREEERENLHIEREKM